MDKIFFLLPLIISLISSFFIAFFSGIFSRVPNSKKTKGTIIGLKHESDAKEGPRRYRAVIEYEIAGKEYQIKSKKISHSYKVGQKIRIAYDATNPNNAIIKPNADIYFFIALWIVAGVAMSVIIYI